MQQYLLPPPASPLLLVAPRAPHPSSSSSSSSSVLIVEDDEIVSEMLVTVLSEEEEEGIRAGTVFFVTPSAQGAQTYLSARKQMGTPAALPVLVLLDFLLLGRETGGDLLRWMQDDPVLAALPVILIPASRPGERRGIDEAIPLATRTVYKPFEVGEFLAVVRAVCPCLFFGQAGREAMVDDGRE